MGATTFAAFDPEPTYLGTVIDMLAGSAVLKGHLVSAAGTGDSWKVVPATTSTGAPIGVALYSQATSGGPVAVAAFGSVVKMMNALDNTAIDAGDQVAPGATAGMIIAAAAPSGGADCWSIGIALENIAASEKGYVLINGPVLTPVGAA
jgi:hypothetical protein